MGLEPWDEVRTALHVARAGTVSGAATTLGVHHATVIRHIDALEDRMAIKLFQRHAKGYTPTEAGQALFAVAAETEQRFEQLAARLQDLQEGISGALVITTIPELSFCLVEIVAELVATYPKLDPVIRIEERVARLEYGEAHIALRAGSRPSEPDNVVQPLGHLPNALFGHPDYLDRHGSLESDQTLAGHCFVSAPKSARMPPYATWLTERGARMALVSNDQAIRFAAICAGLGLGFLPEAQGLAAGLVRAHPAQPSWAAPIWLVAHVDLHRSPKVQACTRHLRAHLAKHLSA